MTSLTMNRWLLAVIATAIISARNAKSFTPTPSCFLAFNNHPQTYPPGGGIIQSSATRLLSSASSSSSSPQQPQTTTAAAPPPPPLLLPSNEQISSATQILLDYDQSQQTFVKADGSQGLGGGSSALNHIQSLDEPYRASLQNAIRALVHRAHSERAVDSARGRIMLGFCASNAPEALAGLKSWVSSVELPRGMLHGMDVDGVPIPVEELGAVYVKYSTGGAMTFRQMRNSGKGFDALWRPGDALLETYDGDFRGVYLNVELGDGEFRQFGVLPTDLFMEEEEW